MPPVVVTKRLTPEGVKLMKTALPYLISLALALTKAKLRSLAEVDTPVDTGRLLASFDVAVTPKSIVARWSAQDPVYGKEYASFPEIGVPPHTIRPRLKKVLRFEYPKGSGNIVFAKKVEHPGQVAQHYTEGVRLAMVETFQSYLAQLIEAWSVP